MRLVLLSVVVMLCGCSDSAPPLDLEKLSRPRQILELRALIAKAGSRELWNKLGEVALEEGDAVTAIEAFQKSADATQEKLARAWMDPGAFPAAPTGTAAELYASAASVQLAINSTFLVRANVIGKLTRAGRLFLEAGDRKAAGECVQRAQPLVVAILKTTHPSLLAYHLAADHDDLYGDMLFGNRHWGDARGMYQNNVMRFKAWDPPNEYTRKRLEQARVKVAACEKKMIP